MSSYTHHHDQTAVIRIPCQAKFQALGFSCTLGHTGQEYDDLKHRSDYQDLRGHGTSDEQHVDSHAPVERLTVLEGDLSSDAPVQDPGRLVQPTRTQLDQGPCLQASADLIPAGGSRSRDCSSEWTRGPRVRGA